MRAERKRRRSARGGDRNGQRLHISLRSDVVQVGVQDTGKELLRAARSMGAGFERPGLGDVGQGNLHLRELEKKKGRALCG